MNVAILTSSHSTFDTRIFHKESRALATDGHDVTIVTPHDEDTKRDGVEIRAVSNQDIGSARLKDALSIYRAAKSMNADVYHLHDPGLLPFGVLLSLQTDGKVIYDCHEQYEIAFKYYNTPPDILNPLLKYYPYIESLVCKNFDSIVTTTEPATEEFRKQGHEHVVTVRNFPEVESIEIGEAPLERDTEYVLGYVGNIDETRGFTRMIELVAHLQNHDTDVGLWVIGEPPEDMSEINRDLRRRNIRDRVTFLGRIDHEDIFSYLHATDVGLALLDPDRFEQDIPLKVFEYMAAGSPVVASPFTAAQKYITDDVGVIVPYERQSKDRMTAVKSLLEDEARRREMGRCARELVETRYSWESEKEKLLSLYEELGGLETAAPVPGE